MRKQIKELIDEPLISETAFRATPTVTTASAAIDTLSYSIGECALGRMLVARSAKGVCAILMGAGRNELETDLAARFSRARLVMNKAVVEDDVAKVIRFVEKPSEGLHLTLDRRGTPFQRRVWEKIRAIPVGRTVSYSELARWISPLASPRAVAGACAANAIALAIPCHRVGGNGDRMGYRWGIERKRELIRKEAMKPHSRTIKSACAVTSAETRVAAYDWQAIAGELDDYGCAVLPKLLSPEECRTIAALYADENRFRSQVHMARHGFGRGEYRYFKYPLPDLLAGLRTALYPHLAAGVDFTGGEFVLTEQRPRGIIFHDAA